MYSSLNRWWIGISWRRRRSNSASLSNWRTGGRVCRMNGKWNGRNCLYYYWLPFPCIKTQLITMGNHHYSHQFFPLPSSDFHPSSATFASPSTTLPQICSLMQSVLLIPNVCLLWIFLPCRPPPFFNGLVVVLVSRASDRKRLIPSFPPRRRSSTWRGPNWDRERRWMEGQKKHWFR